MLIQDFVKRAIEQDERNYFEETVVEKFVPNELKEFYQKANPVDAEITMDGNAVRFIPMSELEDFQAEYSLGKSRFAFASCNGDPIYVYEEKIYTCCHGIGKVKDELMANSLSLFMDMID